MFGGARRGIALAVAAALLGVAGCGGDGSGEQESTASDQPELAVAIEPATAFANRMAKLIETTTKRKDCAQLDDINAHSYIRFGCPAEKALRRGMADFEVVGADEYDTGAVVDYKSSTAKDGAAIVLFVAADRRWGISRFGLITPRSAGTSDGNSRAGYDKAVDDYLAAVRERDCRAFSKVAVDTGEEQDVCKTTFALTKGLAKRIEQNPTATPTYMGGNGSYGFYSYEFTKPRPENFTISVLKEPVKSASPYVVLDAAPSPTKAAQRETRQDLRKQLKQKKKKANPAMEPSSKPSDPAVTTP